MTTSLDDYKRSIAVMEELGVFDRDPELLTEVQARIAKQERVLDYAIVLASTTYHSNSPSGNAVLILQRLFEDGWTPPEGLL